MHVMRTALRNPTRKLMEEETQSQYQSTIPRCMCTMLPFLALYACHSSIIIAKQPPASSLFGVSLTSLVPPGVVKVPPFLEQCFQFLEDKGIIKSFSYQSDVIWSLYIGLYTEGVYRKSAGVSSKKAVRAALEEGILIRLSASLAN